MKVLALELSTARGSIAFRSGDTASEREWPNDRKNSGPFFENLADFRKQFGPPEMIIVGLGPGSYAGTRIAISAAIGLQAATQAPLIGFPSIAALECSSSEYFFIGDARRRSFFLARVRDHKLTEGPTLMSESDLRARLSSLDPNLPVFSSEDLTRFGAKICYPSAQVLAILATNGRASPISAPLEPMYLREPHITVPRSAIVADNTIKG